MRFGRIKEIKQAAAYWRPAAATQAQTRSYWLEWEREEERERERGVTFSRFVESRRQTHPCRLPTDCHTWTITKPEKEQRRRRRRQAQFSRLAGIRRLSWAEKSTLRPSHHIPALIWQRWVTARSYCVISASHVLHGDFNPHGREVEHMYSWM